MDFENIMNYFKDCCGMNEKKPPAPSQSMETIVAQPTEYPRVIVAQENKKDVYGDVYAHGNTGYNGYAEQPRVVVNSNPVSTLDDQPRIAV
ncbi:hypothetical protein HDV04_004463 [Boothiomyces sp. JEL0838]|nr:hypothetical protein HDV04_004463 [Boothiomyces sp. JEL0838]